MIARTPIGTENGVPFTAPGAAIGGNTKDSAFFVFSLWTMQAPDAPSDAADGRVTASAKYIATAASVALPPARQNFAPDFRGAPLFRGDRRERSAPGDTREIPLVGGQARRIGGVLVPVALPVRLTKATTCQQK